MLVLKYKCNFNFEKVKSLLLREELLLIYCYWHPTIKKRKREKKKKEKRKKNPAVGTEYAGFNWCVPMAQFLHVWQREATLRSGCQDGTCDLI